MFLYQIRVRNDPPCFVLAESVYKAIEAFESVHTGKEVTSITFLSSRVIVDEHSGMSERRPSGCSEVGSH